MTEIKINKYLHTEKITPIYKYGERILKDEKDNIKSRVDFGSEHRKSAIY